MSEEDLRPSARQMDGYRKLQGELDKESDRGAVLVAGAMLEEALKEVLVMHLVPNPTATDPLFDGPTAPLQSFSSKIDAGYRLGIISDRFCRDMHVIRRIRNTVAHRAAGCSFQDASIEDRVKALSASHGIFERSPKWTAKRNPMDTRRQFIEAVSWMLFFLHAEVDRVDRRKARPHEFGYSAVMDAEKPTEKPAV
jgi:DNA-binding MltR family transcriptional regulator